MENLKYREIKSCDFVGMYIHTYMHIHKCIPLCTNQFLHLPSSQYHDMTMAIIVCILKYINNDVVTDYIWTVSMTFDIHKISCENNGSMKNHSSSLVWRRRTRCTRSIVKLYRIQYSTVKTNENVWHLTEKNGILKTFDSVMMTQCLLMMNAVKVVPSSHVFNFLCRKKCETLQKHDSMSKGMLTVAAVDDDTCVNWWLNSEIMIAACTVHHVIKILYTQGRLSRSRFMKAREIHSWDILMMF